MRSESNKSIFLSNGKYPFATFEAGIGLDTYESGLGLVENEGGKPRILSLYHSGSEKLASFLPKGGEDYYLDLSARTGISTFEILLKNPDVNVVSFVDSEGLYEIVKYKFGISDGEALLEKVDDVKLLEYWNKFRSVAIAMDLKSRTEFLIGDFQESDDEQKFIFDKAIGSNIMHWTDINTSFGSVYKYLKEKGSFFWNTASQFYDDTKFPSSEFGFRYNDFFKCVLDEVCKKGVEVRDYRKLAVPEHDLESIKEITGKQGFNTKQVGTFLVPVDFQTFIPNHLPVFVKGLVISKIEDNDLINIINESISKTMNNPFAFKDTKHKYDINPVFESVKN